MKDHEITELVNKLTAIARDFNEHGCLRELISHEVVTPIQSLTQRNKELTKLLEAADCPNCNGSGAYIYTRGEIHGCQWCARKAEINTGDK